MPDEFNKSHALPKGFHKLTISDGCIALDGFQLHGVLSYCLEEKFNDYPTLSIKMDILTGDVSYP